MTYDPKTLRLCYWPGQPTRYAVLRPDGPPIIGAEPDMVRAAERIWQIRQNAGFPPLLNLGDMAAAHCGQPNRRRLSRDGPPQSRPPFVENREWSVGGPPMP